MLREIWLRVVSTMAWAIVLTAVDIWIFPRYDISVETFAIPETAHALIGVALGLLLVFRTNASYDRFWEGRKQWGAIVNESRNLGRMISVHLAEDPALAREALRWAALFPWTIMHRLRGSTKLGPQSLVEKLPQGSVHEIELRGHRPLGVAQKITEILVEARRRGLITDYVLTAIDNNVQLLVDCFGACERIHNTPLPFAYVVHLRRALVLYCFTLPFALLAKFGWMTIPATLIISYILFGIEEIGVEIEDPFGDDENDLPLEEISANIEKNIGELMPAGDQ